MARATQQQDGAPPQGGDAQAPTMKRYRLDRDSYFGKGKGMRSAGEIVEYDGKPGRNWVEVDADGNPVNAPPGEAKPTF